jgi:hypothetical protein
MAATNYFPELILSLGGTVRAVLNWCFVLAPTARKIVFFRPR